MIPRVILVEVSKAYKWWCNPCLRRMIGSKLAKKAIALLRIGKDPDQSHMDQRSRACILKSCGYLMITRSLSSCQYMASDLFLLYMLMLFDYNHQGVPRIFIFQQSSLTYFQYLNACKSFENYISLHHRNPTICQLKRDGGLGIQSLLTR